MDDEHYVLKTDREYYQSLYGQYDIRVGRGGLKKLTCGRSIQINTSV